MKEDFYHSKILFEFFRLISESKATYEVLMEAYETLRKRLLYQSQHRGMREMDLILGEFAQKHIKTLSHEELKQFETLLGFPDKELYDWFFEDMPLPSHAPSLIINMIQKDFSNSFGLAHSAGEDFL